MNELTIPGKVELTPTYLKVLRELSEEEYLQIFEYLGNIGNKLMVYVGDLANQEGMVKHGVKSTFYDEVQERTGLKYNTITNAKMIMGCVDPCNRLQGCGIRHYALIYQMENKQQRHWLEKCVDDGWSTKKLKHEIIRSLPSPDLPDRKFELIYADPPWAYDTAESSKEIDAHYPTMELEDLCNMDVKSIAWDNCTLYLWATTARLDWAFPVIEAWGFKYKTSMIWDKVVHNLGHYCSARHELLLIAGKGHSEPADQVLANSIDSVQSIPKSKIHSKKPFEIRDILDSLYPDKKKIQMFSRDKYEGWTNWGNKI